jgi:uncharacterized protein (TIGR02453 family)
MNRDLSPVFPFLTALALHNDRGWFEAHRTDYDRAREAVEAFVFDLFGAIGVDRGTHKASFWFHRIYRDVRFSRERTPYKTHFSAVLDAGGKKAPGLGTYFHLQPGNESVVGGGLWAPEPAALKKFRLDMEDGPRAFLQILEAPEFQQRLHLLDGQKLKKVPKGFPEDHPAAELFKLKQVVAWRTFTDEEVLAPRFADEVAATIRALDPFLRYLEESAGLVAPRD